MYRELGGGIRNRGTGCNYHVFLYPKTGSPAGECKKRLLESLPRNDWELDEPGRQQLTELILEYQDIFALSDTELGGAEGVVYDINTGDQEPIKPYPCHVPFALQQKMEGMIQKMLSQGVIQPSHNPWASPVVLVAKKVGTTCFCVDYQKLNAATKMDVYPLPRIDDMLDLLSNN